ncbi:MAG: hydroxyethylthiazole kinase, partial [Candidatus Methanomethylophilaceae archaeon]
IIRRVRPDVIKGNQGEMGILSGVGGDVKGVDSHGVSGDVSEIVRGIARRYGCIAAATGVQDYVSDGETVVRLSNGHDLLGSVSGTGCMVSSVVGCYVGANGPSVDSVTAAISAFNISAEYAARASNGPGTFKPALLDAMYNLSSDDLDSGIRRDVL